MRNLFYVAVVLILAGLNSCGNLNDIRIEEVRNVHVDAIDSPAQLSMDVRVSNPSGRTITLMELDLQFTLNDATVASIASTTPVRIERRSDEFHKMVLDVHLQNMFALLSLRKNKMDRLTVSGTLKAKVGLIRRTINIEKQPLSTFAPQLLNLKF